jgi:hypothetical protein
MSALPDPGPSPEPRTACFSVHACADPSVMPRVLAVFTRLGIIPTVWHSAVCGSDREEIQIDVQVADLEPGMSDRVAQCLRQLVCVGCVLTSEKRYSISA